MKNNSQTNREPPHDFNPLIWLWKGLTTNQVVIHCIPKYIKLVEIIIVQVIGSMEDEHTFNIISFMRSKPKNKFTSHLDLVICMVLIVLHPWEFCRWCCHPRMEGDVCMVWWWHKVIDFYFSKVLIDSSIVITSYNFIFTCFSFLMFVWVGNNKELDQHNYFMLSFVFIIMACLVHWIWQIHIDMPILRFS
jgi:hypothetical protein